MIFKSYRTSYLLMYSIYFPMIFVTIYLTINIALLTQEKPPLDLSTDERW